MLEQFQEGLEQLHASTMAILVLLIQKEFITEEEFVKAKLFAQHTIDQESASKREEFLKELKEKQPFIYELFKKINDRESE